MSTDPRYPIGKAEIKSSLTPEQRKDLLDQIAYLPANLREAVRGMNDAQLDTPYRDGGWTVRQLVHHIADSHMNAYIRFKLGLTEDTPTIKPYDENSWAKLKDSSLPVEGSLALIDSLHRRWVALMFSVAPEDFQKGIKHPERGEMKLDALVSLYAWHGQHHTAHITELKKRQGWK
jgi:uncharacterized damage-inducible protein DinB